ncbi:MAG: SDR family NAD(P)-dependent oxidoreductase [Bryobacteraceae bacterium]|nr:SDR family NAD(P)-dependent oxidoreductase [Bryobacteraceae bacterium]
MKTVLITGANGGLGSVVTTAFLDAGAGVAGVAPHIADTDFPHPGFAAFPADLSTAAAAAELVRRVEERLGPVDALVHLVGGFSGGTRVEETGDDVVERMFAMNFKTALHAASAVLPGMRSRGRGRLLAIGARPAVEPRALLGAYAASKAAMVSLWRTLALENKDCGITANVILPGTIDTPANRKAMPEANPSGWITPAQIASLLVHLASDNGAAVSGALIPMYGAEV